MFLMSEWVPNKMATSYRVMNDCCSSLHLQIDERLILAFAHVQLTYDVGVHAA